MSVDPTAAPALTFHRPAGYAPMRVVAVMDEPIGYLGDLLHLDAPLSYAAYHALDLQTRKSIAPPGSPEFEDWPIDLELPLSTWWLPYVVHEHGAIDPRLCKRNRNDPSDRSQRLWGWCASAADEAAWGVRSKLEVRKRPELGRMARYTDARSANISSGHMKAYDLAVPTVFAREVVWFAHGDADRVRDLLNRFVPAIGKKRNIGSGTVREWRVEACDEDRSTVTEGAPRRRLPCGAARSDSMRLGAIRPPYYHHTRTVMAVEP